MTTPLAILRSERGSLLIAVFTLLTAAGFLSALALNRSINGEALTKNSYFEQVALDLAESGVEVAIARIRAGRAEASGTLSVDLGPIAQFQGIAQASLTKTPNGYKVMASGLLKDKKGQLRFTQRVIITGHLANRRAFVVDSWKELPIP
jgi:Tfp pilus assembly protein PilX